MKRLLLGATILVVAACSSQPNDSDATDPTDPSAATTATNTDPSLTVPDRSRFPDPPEAPTGANDAATAEFDSIIDNITLGLVGNRELQAFIDAGDARHAWLVSDLLRFISAGAEAETLIAGFETLTGADVANDEQVDRSPWNVVTNHLIAWDTPAPPDYRRLKGALFALAEPGWTPFFDDAESEIDWRWVSWGGVFIDDRPLGDPDPCDRPGCIPALDDPELVAAADGDWYADDRIVFGVTEGDEAVAFPKNIMQVHEMVNISIGGRRFGIPYCTLCGSAQAFYTDVVPDGIDTLVLRTSGLLNRSNKVMYDLNTRSVLDTFTGAAVSGPLLDAELVLDQNSVSVTTWGEWKREHPHTTIVAEDGGIGRSYPDDPLRGRDDNGPIFPIGDVDPRLGVHEPVVGVLLDDGTTLAFPAALARAVLDFGRGGRVAGRLDHCRRWRSGRIGRRHRGRHARGVLVRLEPVPPRHAAVAERQLMTYATLAIGRLWSCSVTGATPHTAHSSERSRSDCGGGQPIGRHDTLDHVCQHRRPRSTPQTHGHDRPAGPTSQ